MTLMRGDESAREGDPKTATELLDYAGRGNRTADPAKGQMALYW